ncbi:transcription factor HES-5-like [Carassius carassius]|uniref:transcription factor HES-5-like n=1 Tax=Carassius carassius TaxID=217509 RepID=UPI00286851E9|nr:transcription factor HES-5-like [Carassius carassius]
MTATIISKELLPLNNKLRKPMVEKMCRDRINSSIEQLKCLLAPEFLEQQTDSKSRWWRRCAEIVSTAASSSSSVFWLQSSSSSRLIQADFLEMKVNFLQQHNSSSHAVNQGFFRSVGEIVHFLFKDEMKTQSQRRLLKHVQKLQTSCDQNRRESVLPDQKTSSKDMNVNKSAIWRP